MSRLAAPPSIHPSIHPSVRPSHPSRSTTTPTTTRLAAIYIAGNNIVSVNQVGKAQVVFKIVALKRGVMDYRNNLFIARNVGWRLTGRLIPGDFFDRHRKAAIAMAAEVSLSVSTSVRGMLAGVLDPFNNTTVVVAPGLPTGHAQSSPTLPSLPCAPPPTASPQTIGEPAPEGTADYNHLPIEEAINRFRASRKLHPPEPEHHQPRHRGRRAQQASYDLQEYILKATEGLAPQPASVVKGGVSLTDPPAAAVPVVNAISETAGPEAATSSTEGDDAGSLAGVLQAEMGSGGTFNMTGTEDRPWFYFANHPGLQARGSRTDKIYLADEGLSACSLCGVTSDGDDGSGLAVNVDGPGAPNCAMSDACEAPDATKAEAGAGEGVRDSLKGQPEFASMWVTDSAAPLPNTTIGTVFLRATLTPGRTEGGAGEHTTVGPEQVHAALNATIVALGLPTRFHLRVERAVTPETMDPMFSPDIPDYLKEGSGAPARRRLKAQRAAQRRRLVEAAGELGGEQECGRNELFKAYVVSDWKNVTDAVARVIRSPEAEALLTRLLQERADADAAEGRSPLAFADISEYHVRALDEEEPPAEAPMQPPAVCTLVAYRTTSLHIPSTKVAGVLSGAYRRVCRQAGRRACFCMI